MIEFESVTTRGGDRGESSLFNGERLRKDDTVFTALGDLDELSSTIGLSKAMLTGDGRDAKKIRRVLEDIQMDLIRIGGQVATPERDPLYEKLTVISGEDVESLEKIERKFMAQTDMPRRFILPGSTVVGGYLDLARAVCRRAERQVVACIRDRNMGKLYECQHYLNRLSDLLFVLARWIER